jgi:hypothetical protein
VSVANSTAASTGPTVAKKVVKALSAVSIMVLASRSRIARWPHGVAHCQQSFAKAANALAGRNNFVVLGFVSIIISEHMPSLSARHSDRGI